ncbi:lamin tail domain-containing protein [Loktanella sp. R86503]|uniref:lamin tail domain-containing protein n=1 Tax=Loktanella sp. R86503 TaxID=3093847 RepID=UPI0036DA1E32
MSTLQSWEATVTHIVDGDTFDVVWSDGYSPPPGLLDRIRIAGIDTNETSTNEPLAQEAKARLSELIPVGTVVTLQAIDEQSSTLDRPVRHVLVNGENVATILIEEGLGLAASYQFEPSYRDAYFAASGTAQLAGAGLWSLFTLGTGTTADVRIFVNFDAAGNDADNINDEYIVIQNTSGATLDISNWTIRSSARLEEGTLEIPGGVTIAAGGSIRVHVGSGTNTAESIYLHQPEPIFNNTGDVVYLRDTGLNIRGTQLWPDSIFHQPTDSIVIEDVQFDAPGDDALNSNGEWIVIRNAGDTAVDLSDWRIKDDGFDYVFAPGETLAAGDRLTIHIGSGTDTGDERYWSNTEGILNNAGGSLEIWTPYSNNVDTFAWGDVAPAAENIRGALQMSVNYDAAGSDTSNPNGEWVALYNSGSTDIDLSGFHLNSGSQTHSFGAGTIVAPGENLRILIGQGTDSELVQYWGNSGAILSNSGDSVTLVDDNGAMILHEVWSGTAVAEYDFGLVISTVNYDAAGNDSSNPNGEWLVIRNASAAEQNLVNWQIRVGPEQFTILEDTPIAAGATITVYVGSGTDTPGSLYMGFSSGIMYNSGSRAIELLTPDREIAETTSWGQAVSLDQSVAAAVDLSVNYDAVGADDNNPNGEWVNIRNLSSSTISLDGYHLYTDGTSYHFDSDDTVQAGARIRVYLGNGTDTHTSLFASGALDSFNNDGDEVELRSNVTGYAVDQFAYPVSTSRIPEAQFEITGVNQDAPGSDAENPNGEWIDITNTGTSAASLQDWRIQYQTATFFDFDADIIVGAGDTIRIYMGQGNNTQSELFWGNTGGILSNTAGTLVLQSPYRTVADTLAWPDIYAGDDEIFGTDDADTIRASTGNDRVYAGKGDDYVDLGAGDDYVRVGGGREEFHGGSGSDYISYYSSTGGLNINLATNEVSGSWAVNDTISGFESVSGSRLGGDTIYGTSGANTIKTYGGDDTVYAGAGNDRVELGSGDDYVRVGGGAESFDGGSGTDYISYYDSTNGIRIDLEADSVSGSWAVNDTIKNFESAAGSNTGHDTMLGTSGANTLRGYDGNDRLYGRGGSDKLYGGGGDDFFDGGGGSGTDLLYGGTGADTFHFDSGEGVDVVKDFENNVDTIELDNFNYLNVSDALNDAEQVGTDVVFDFGADGILTIANTTKAALLNDLELV